MTMMLMGTAKALPKVDAVVTSAVNKGLGALKAGPKVPVVKVQVSAPDVKLAQVSVPQQDHHAHKPGHRRHQATLDAKAAKVALNKTESFPPGVNLPAIYNPDLHPPVIKTFNTQNPNFIAELDGVIGALPRSNISMHANYGSQEKFAKDVVDTFTKDVKLFHGKVKEDMVLINFHDGAVPVGNGRTLAWQAPIKEGMAYQTSEEMVQSLALKYPTWGERNAFTVIRVPKGETATYLKGEAAEQKIKDALTGRISEFTGGGTQLKFMDIKTNWIQEQSIPLPEVMKTIGSKKK